MDHGASFSNSLTTQHPQNLKPIVIFTNSFMCGTRGFRTTPRGFRTTMKTNATNE